LTKLDLENKIVSLISVNYGLKGQDLILRMMSLNLEITQNEVMDIIFDMIHRGELVEIELVYPNHTSKSFIVLKDTLVNVIRRR
jgi:hypothetical protein